MEIFNQLDEKASFKVVEHVEEGRSEEITKIRGNLLSQAAKAMLLVGKIAGGERVYFLAVLPAHMMVNYQELYQLKIKSKISDADLKIKSIRMATPEEVKELTECKIGAVPPFSFNPTVKLVIDPRLISENTEIVFNAGRLDRSIFMRAADYERIAKADAAEFIEFGQLRKKEAETSHRLTQ